MLTDLLKSFDNYTVKARLAPVFFTVLPIGMGLGAWISFDKIPLGLLTTAVSSFALLTFLSQVGRDRGKAMQEQLFKDWGGMPSVVMLSYSHSAFPPGSLNRYHQRLTQLIPGISCPVSKESEQQSQGKAIEAYTSASDWLRSATRDREKFKLIHVENTNYGYRRNLLGLKPHGLTMAVIGLLSTTLRSVSPLLDSGFPKENSGLAIVYSLACLAFLLMWIFVVRPEWVRSTANEYAKQLIESIDRL